MRLIKLIAPAVLIAVLALFAPRADAQTMGEYATTVGVASGGSMGGTSFGPSSVGSEVGGGLATWGSSSLGANFDERAGAASAAGAGANFDSRAGSMTGGSTSQSRWPESRLTDSSNRFGGDSASRFGDSSGRFPTGERFSERNELSSSSDRFSDNRNGLDTTYNRNELDASHNSGGLDNSYNPVNY
jgi:hypothetical protein